MRADIRRLHGCAAPWRPPTCDEGEPPQRPTTQPPVEQERQTSWTPTPTSRSSPSMWPTCTGRPPSSGYCGSYGPAASRPSTAVGSGSDCPSDAHGLRLWRGCQQDPWWPAVARRQLAAPAERGRLQIHHPLARAEIGQVDEGSRSRRRTRSPRPESCREGRPGTQGVRPAHAPLRSGTRRSAARHVAYRSLTLVSSSIVDGSLAGTPSCLSSVG
jgi:hypothetical protein